MSRNRYKKSYENAYKKVVQDAQQKGAPTERYIGGVIGGEREVFDKDKLYIRHTPIAWGVPMDEIMYSKFFTLFIRHAGFMPWDTFITTESTYLPDARNAIHDMFLQSDYPYLMMLDSDILFPPLMVANLMRLDLPIVGGWYKNKNQFKGGPYPIIYDYKGQNSEGHYTWKHFDVIGTGVQKVDGMGAGCWLMKREVAERLGESPYDMAGGTEDLKLSKKLLDLGIPLHVDWSINCAHVGVMAV